MEVPSEQRGAALAGTIDLGDLTVNRLGFGAMRLCGDSAWGISNVTVAQLDLARSITPIVSVQNAYNLRNQTSEDVLVASERLGIA